MTVLITATPIEVSDLTTASVDGTGVFDVLMRSVKGHLEQEFTKGRIKGNEYATVYLGAMQSTLNAAVQFALQRELQNAEISVKESQKCLLDAQFDKTVAETGMVVDLRQKTAAETNLLDAKTINEGKQGIVLDKQALLLVEQAEAFDKDHLAKMQDLRVKEWATARTTDPDNTPRMPAF